MVRNLGYLKKLCLAYWQFYVFRSPKRLAIVLSGQHSYASAQAELPKPPDNKDEHDQAQGTNGTVLLQEQLPVDPHRSSLILRRIFS